MAPARWSTLRGRSAAELAERAQQRLAAWLEQVGLRDAGEPTDRILRERLRRNVASVGLDAVVTSVRDRVRPRGFASLDDLRRTARLLRERWPDRAAAIVREADAIREGRLQLLGYGATVYPDPITWSHDPRLGVGARSAHWSRIPFLEVGVVGDHKLVWELNRHQFLVTLGQAYVLTGDERYAERAVALLTSWMDANPPKRGINWASSLEVAYRAIAWTWTMRLLKRSPTLSGPFILRWLKFINISARHLTRFLSTWFSPNTHLTGEALGLLYLGTQFPEFQDARSWREHGWAILRQQLSRQVRADGTYFEQAIYYHRYTLDIYLHARILGAVHHLPGIDAIDEALGRLAEVLRWMARSDGTIPLFGDEDGGRLLFLDARPGDDVRAPLATAAALLGRNDLVAGAGDGGDELLWMLGEEGVLAFDRLLPAPPNGAARGFPDGGWYVMRDGWAGDAAVLTVDCGPLGAGNGGHAHADTLAIDLAIGNSPIFVDGGTVTYTGSPAERDLFRSSAVHNTVTLDGISSSECAGPFQWSRMTDGELDAWHVTPNGAYFEGHHDGYGHLPLPARLRRSIIGVRGGWWLVRDVIESDGTHDVAITFQCAPALDAVVAGRTVRVADDGDLLIELHALGADTGVWRVDDGVASRRYGSREGAPRVRYAFRSSGRAAATFAITRGSGTWQVVLDRSAGCDAVRLHGGGYDDLVLFEPREAVDGVRTDARVAWLRRRASDLAVESLMVVGGTVVEFDGARVVEQGGGAVTAVRERGAWRVASEGPIDRPHLLRRT